MRVVKQEQKQKQRAGMESLSAAFRYRIAILPQPTTYSHHGLTTRAFL